MHLLYEKAYCFLHVGGTSLSKTDVMITAASDGGVWVLCKGHSPDGFMMFLGADTHAASGVGGSAPSFR